MQCPKCGAKVDALEYAREQGWRKVPSPDEIYRMLLKAWRKIHVAILAKYKIPKGKKEYLIITKPVAQALHDALLEVNHEQYRVR